MVSPAGAWVSTVQSVWMGGVDGKWGWSAQREEKNRHWDGSDNGFVLRLLFWEASATFGLAPTSPTRLFSGHLIPWPLELTVIVFYLFSFNCVSLRLVVNNIRWDLQYNTHISCTVSGPSAQEARAFRWQEAALSMETAFWADLPQVRHKRTQMHAIWCHLWKR